PVPSEKSGKGYPIGLIGTLSLRKIRNGVSNRAYWNPFPQKSQEKGIQSGLLEPVHSEKSGIVKKTTAASNIAF
uniref:hypothetical protein n=1 Tax=Neobacillus soli TaxID=220688 RepID=UPI000B04A7EB